MLRECNMKFCGGRLCLGILMVTCIFNILFGIWLFVPARITSRHKKQRESNATDPMKLYRTFTGVHQPILHHNASVKHPAVTGAIYQYVSLLDSQVPPATLHCSSCALVSSSGFILGKEAGKEIDQHPCVIRMNTAPVEGYERDVGERTTLRVLNFFTGVKAWKMPPGSIFMIWGLYQHKPHLDAVMNMLKELRPGIAIYGQTVQGEREAGQLFQKETGQALSTNRSWLSTGWFTMMIALDICDKLHVYGMVPADYCASKPKVDFPYHYYKKWSAKECATYNAAETRRGAHRFITEKAVFGRWAQQNNITFHHPEWTLDKDKLAGKLDTPFINKIVGQQKNKPKK